MSIWSLLGLWAKIKYTMSIRIVPCILGCFEDYMRWSNWRTLHGIWQLLNTERCCHCCWVASVVSDSSWPHRLQPTRLPHPWDSPGKSTRVGCHFLLQCMKVKSESEVAQSCLTPRDPMDCSPPGSPVPGILQARVLEWGAIAFSVNTE